MGGARQGRAGWDGAAAERAVVYGGTASVVVWQQC